MKNFHVMLNSKSYTYQSLRAKPLEISYSSVNFFSDCDEVLLVSVECVLTEELGIHQCGLPTSEEHDSPEEFGIQISDRCCATRQLSQNIYPPNDHIIEGHLCLIMSGCSLGYKQPPPTTTSWSAAPGETDTCHLRASHPSRTLSENHQVRENPNPNTYKPKVIENH